MGTQWKDGYSAHVELTLVVDGERLPVAQVGPEAFILRNARELAPCFADLIVRIDDTVHNYRIAVYDGASQSNPIVKYEDVPVNGASIGKQYSRAT
jgi:hypothetical protein